MRIASWISWSGVAALGVAACGGAGVSGRAPEAAKPAQPVANAGACGRLNAASTSPSPLSAPRTGSTVALAKHAGKTLAYVADEDERAVHVIDVDSGAKLGSTPLDSRPSQLMFLRDGRLAVALRDKGKVAVFEPSARVAEPLEMRCSVETAAEPVGLALSADDASLVVTSGWGKSLAVFDGKTVAKKFELAMDREPRAVIVSDDGAKAFVSHAVGGQLSIVSLSGAQRVKSVALHGTPDQIVAKAKEAADPLTGASCQGYSLAKVGPRVLAPQVLVDAGNIEETPSGYGDDVDQTESPSVAVIDEAQGTVLPASLTISSDPIAPPAENGHPERSECLLPRAAAYDAKNGSLLVACFGIDSVVAYDAMATSPARAEKRRWFVGNGPTGIAVDDEKHRAVVWSQFERALSRIPLDAPEAADEKKNPVVVARTVIPADAGRQIPFAISLGRMLFHSAGDGRISHDGRACASCHPDGRDDAITWATPDGPRRSIMLAGRLAKTAPYSWSGGEDELKQHIGITFTRLKGEGGLKATELEALAQYIQSLAPPPEHTNKAEPKVVRGKELFASAATECASCHSGDQATDNRTHNVKSKAKADQSSVFNTPSLRFVGGTGPYFHDGRYKTLRALLTSTDGTMGHTKHLSPDDLDALEAYLRTL